MNDTITASLANHFAAVFENEGTAGEMLDLSKLFDDDAGQEVHMDAGENDLLAPRPIAPSMLRFNSNPFSHSNCQSVQKATQTPNEITQQQQEQLVNVLFLVDPVTHQIIFPQPGISLSSRNKVLDNPKDEKIFQTPFTLPGFPFLGGDKQNFPQVVPNDNLGQCRSPTTPLEQTFQYHQTLLAANFQKQQQQELRSVSPSEPPLRALSAYNFFFRDERDRILNERDHDWSPDKQEQLLREHWCRDRSKKRRHRKTHGKIDFTTLSKLISARWKELPEDRKDFYREVASKDWERYQTELTEYKAAAADLSIPSIFHQVVG